MLQRYAITTSRARLITIIGAAVVSLFAITCRDGGGPNPFDLPDTSDTNPPPARDTTPPQAVTDAALAIRGAPDDIALTWTAPCDDSLPEAVKSYVIRYSLSYSAMQLWDLTMPVLAPPAPSLPGTVQQCGGFDFIERGRNLYAAMKCIDEAGNVSALSNIASVRIPGYRLAGICTDAASRQPAAGVSVRILAGIVINLESDADGRFAVDDLPKDVYLGVSTGGSPVAYHTIYEHIRLLRDSSLAVAVIPYETVLSGAYPSLLQLFKELTRTTADYPSTILRKYRRTPVRCHIPPFVNAYGVDYGALARRAAQRWMDATGWELFSFVDSPPDTGITFDFRTAEEMGILRGITEHTDGSDNLPLRDTVAIADYFNDAGFVYRVCLHEMGHTVRLGHVSTKSYIMYAGQPLPGDISPDEIAVMNLLRGIPNLTDMAKYDEAAP